MHRWVSAGLVALLVSAGGRSQTVPVGSCERGTAIGVLETSALRVMLKNDGQLFHGQTSDGYASGQYIVPKTSGTYPTENAGLWISGVVGDSLRSAVSYFFPGDFWPGPLADAENPPQDCSAHDRMWTVSRADVARYVETGEVTADLAEWPVQAGAPVIDGDGDPTNYDLDGGDQPDLLGDVAVWWSMNDAGNRHGTVNHESTAPLGIEIRVHAFAFEQSPFPAVPSTPLREATFHRYEVHNRRDVPIDSIYVSLHTFGRTGAHGNDFMGTDTLRQVAYIYNHPEATDAYGDRPAAWGIQVLDGPVGLANGRDDDGDGVADEADERIRLTSSPPGFFLDSYWYPSTARRLANAQKGLHSSGVPFGAIGGGEICWSGSCEYGEPTVFAFPANPAEREFWSEMNIDGEGGLGFSYHREFMVSTGPFRLLPGESAAILYGMPFARTPSSLESVSALRAFSEGFLAAFGEGFPTRPVEVAAPSSPASLAVTRVRPNPASGGQAALLSLPDPTLVEAVVLDVLGRRVAVVADGTLPAGTAPLAIPDDLTPGTYLLRVTPDRGRPTTLAFTVVPR